MNYVEIIERQEVLQKELQELQEKRVKIAQEHNDMEIHETLSDEVSLDMVLSYDGSKTLRVVRLTQGGQTVTLEPEELNKTIMVAQKYNDVLFSYMSEITKKDDDDEDTEEVE